MVDASAGHPWEQGLPLARGRRDRSMARPATVRVLLARLLGACIETVSRNRLGVPSRLMIFPDENHWVLNAGNSLKWHYEVFKWFDEFVGENASIRERN